MAKKTTTQTQRQTKKPSAKAPATKAKSIPAKSNHELGAGAMGTDQELLDRVVVDINKLHHGKCEAIGQYLLKAFFNGDVGLYASDPDNLTFRGLQRRDDLEVPYSTLCMVMNTMAQRTVLGTDLADSLGFSHQTRMLSIKDPIKKRELAQQAVEKAWTVKQLDQQLASVKGRSSSGGITPSGVKACFTRLQGAVEKLQDTEIAKFLKEVQGPKRKSLLKEVERGIKGLQKLQIVLIGKSKK